MAKGHGKGSAWEREISTQLSLWWSHGKNDAIFWRATTSGARATTRLKKNKRTTGAHGDITAIDSIGKPLMDAVTWECKRGYKHTTISELLDKPKDAAAGQFEQWLLQAEAAAAASGSFSWALIVKRDRRDPLVVAPGNLMEAIEEVAVAKKITWGPVDSHFGQITWFRKGHNPSASSSKLYVIRWGNFLKYDPRIFVEIAKM